ncbi:MAG: hypothetical protein KI792_03695 [Alphaproteobacteria bacterium]|nr:hypothetical protein [Alphaproteobacteria bacterium SS10]
MSKTERAEIYARGERVSVYFPDARQPALRSFSGESDVEMTLSKLDDGWGIFMATDGGKAEDPVAIYDDEAAANDAMTRTAMILAGHKPKDSWWYARWSAVLLLLGVIAAMEIYFATVSPEDLMADGAAVSSSGSSFAAVPGGVGGVGASSLPGTSFGGTAGPAPSNQAAAAPFTGGYGSLPSGPAPGASLGGGDAQVQRPQQPGGLSAFGLDDRSPPGGANQENPLFNLDNGN